MNQVKKNKIISVFCHAVCIGIFFSAFIKPCSAATSSIIIDAKTGNVLSSNAADTLRYPASLTKLMTLYITFDALEKGLIRMDDKFPVSRRAANMAPSRLGLRPGEKIKIKDAVMALIVKSANDCAVVLAEGLGYSEENFAKTMTKVARELGMKNTTFRNASGLPNKQQKTTARDMALLGAAMYHHFPQYYKLFSAKKFTYKNQTIYTHNHLLKTFDGADGMKTGFTNAAGFNIVTSAERNGKRVIAVTMGHNTARMRDKTVAQLMNQGLKKLALNSQVAESKMYADISAAPKAEKTQNNKQIRTQNVDENDAIWGIQIGAFSNYAKARNYALSIKKEIAKKAQDKTIDIEPYQTDAAIVYRSKIIGFAKQDATTACDKLKKSKKSCIVIAAEKSSITLANKF